MFSSCPVDNDGDARTAKDCYWNHSVQKGYRIYAAQCYAKIEATYNSRGLLVEKVPYFRDDIKLQLFDAMTNEEIEKLKENIKHVNVWKITVDPAFREDGQMEVKASAGSYKEMPVEPNLPFEVKSSVKDGVFEAYIQGRMVTITTPEFLKRFQEAGQCLTSIHIDVSRMAYVSSAGLRVLLLMYKSLKDKSKFEPTGVNAEVHEILETTGFDQFLL